MGASSLPSRLKGAVSRALGLGGPRVSLVSMGRFREYADSQLRMVKANMKTLNEIPLAPNERAAIEAAARVLREALPVREVILFGSKARGDSDAESDIDLLLLTRRPLTYNEENLIVDLILPIELDHRVILSILEISETEWFEGVYQVLPLRFEVERDGVAA
jgi:predicted nucleotidyltransferase